ncbi:BQ5605_C030g10772 [Microbotryum silenes-dioicae]|uniref:BQ5605_C030g10772 protein n=1 Tax=Microbotryum silenes-dioicae TaxID=796604 RepID=A0A2X0MI14_9BASI|nr:BQ5605_C030g10772 [Microbotryum silenes-dioicae]
MSPSSRCYNDTTMPTPSPSLATIMFVLVTIIVLPLLETDKEMKSDLLSDAMDTDSDASLPPASFSPSENLRSANVTNCTANRSSIPETPLVDTWVSQFWPESPEVSDDRSDLLDRLRMFCTHHFRMNYRLIQALQDHLEMLVRKEEELAGQRYANRAKKYAGRRPGHGLMRCLDVDRNRDHDLFLTDIRMSKKAFDELHKAIKDHAVFKSRGRKPQTPTKIQLAVALWRFGGYGNRASAKAAAEWSGCSMGSVVKFTYRVLLALNEPSFSRRIIRWPNQAERELLNAWMESKTYPEWRNGWCMVDGSLIELSRTPQWFGASFTSRNCRAALNIQIVNTPDGRIIDYTTGLTIFEKHLDPEDFVLADSGYPLESWVLTPYSRGERDSRQNKRFNYYVSCARCGSEHTIGYLKSRFQSLKRLALRINSKDQFEIANQWVSACIVAHRFATEVDWFVGKFDYHRPVEPEEPTREQYERVQRNEAGASTPADNDETQQLDLDQAANQSKAVQRWAELRIAKSIRDRRRSEILRHHPLRRP